MRQKLFQRLCLLTCLLCASLWARGETLTVCEGTGSTNQYVPIYGYYWDTQNNTSTMVYPASMLESMADGTINSLTFYANANVTFQGGAITVQMGEVDQTTVSGKLTGLTDCYTGTPATGAQEYVVTLDEPYEYSGGNLAIQIVIASGGSNYPRTYWYGESQGVNCSVNSAGSAQTFLPKTTFDYSLGEKPDYLVQVSAESLAFGELGVNSTGTLNVTLKNKGTNAVTPTVSGLSAPFSTTYTPAELASGATATIPVTFSPTEVGDHTGTMTIDCGAAGSFTVTLSGSAVMAVILCDGSTGTLATNEGIPIYGYYYDTANSKTRFIYPSSKLTSLVGKQITSVTFYSTNNRASLNGGELSFYAGETEAVAALSATVDDLTEVWKGAMSPGGNELTFVFNTPMTYSGGNLAFGSNVNTKGTYERLYWYGEATDYASACYRTTNAQFLPKVRINYAEPSDYAVAVAPEALDFGTVLVGSSKALEVKVTNIGAQAITPAVSGLEAPFSTTYTAAELAAAANVTIPVTFAPTAGGEFSATLTIDCGEAGTQTVTITGNGLAVPTGYQETFDGCTAEAKIPSGWKSVRTNSINPSIAPNYQYAYDDGFTVVDVDGTSKAIAFDRAQYSNYYYWLITPALKGNVFITGRYTSTSTNSTFKVYPVADDGTIQSGEIAVEWIPALAADGTWSYGSFNLADYSKVAILMRYGSIDFLAADEVSAEKEIALTSAASTAETVAAEGSTAHFTVNAVVKNQGLAAVEAADYQITVANYDTPDEVIATFNGADIAVGASTTVPMEFDYEIPGIQPSQIVRFTVKETLNSTTASTSYVTVTAAVAKAALFLENGTTAYTKQDLGVFRGSRQLKFTIGNKNGTAPLSYTVVPVEGVTVDAAEGTVAEGAVSEAITLTVAGPATYDGVIANITTNGGDLAVEAHAAALAETTFLEDFEDDLDNGWMVGEGYTFPSRPSANDFNQKAAYFYATSSYADPGTMITPAINFDENTGLDFHFTTYRQLYAGSVQAFYSTDRATWTSLGNVATTSSQYVNHTFTLPEAGTYYFKFVDLGCYIDDIYGGERATVEHDAFFETFAGPSEGMVNYEVTYTGTLRNLAEAEEFDIVLVVDGEDVAMVSKTVDGTADFELSFVPHTAGTLEVKAEARVDDYAVASQVIDLVVAQESLVSGTIVNPGTSTTVGNDAGAVINGYFDNTATRLLYTAEQMTAAGVKAGDKITKIALLVSSSARTNPLDFNVWARNSESTGLAAGLISADIDAEGFTQVYANSNILPLVPAAGGELLLNLSEPIVYDGQSLELITTSYGAYQSKYIYFTYNEVANQMLTLRVDGEKTPAELFASNASLQTKLPSLKLYVENEPVTVSGTVTDGDTPIEGAQLSFTQDGKLYEATTDAEGRYSVDIFQPGEDYILTVTAEGYDAYTETRDITESMTWNVNLGGDVPEPITLAGVQFTADNKYATWYGDQDLAAPAGVTVYAVASITDDVAVIEPLTYIPANTGVLLYSETPAEQVQATPYAGETASAESLLVGSLEGMNIGEGYVLYNDAFVLTDGGQLAAHRCYLPKTEVPAGAPARLRIATADGQLVTAISDIANGKAIDKVTYVNAAGQQSDHPYSGINIVVTRYTDGSVSTSKMVVK